MNSEEVFNLQRNSNRNSLFPRRIKFFSCKARCFYDGLFAFTHLQRQETFELSTTNNEEARRVTGKVKGRKLQQDATANYW
jgi:hypothetical protein